MLFTTGKSIIDRGPFYTKGRIFLRIFCSSVEFTSFKSVILLAIRKFSFSQFRTALDATIFFRNIFWELWAYGRRWITANIFPKRRAAKRNELLRKTVAKAGPSNDEILNFTEILFPMLTKNQVKIVSEENQLDVWWNFYRFCVKRL